MKRHARALLGVEVALAVAGFVLAVVFAPAGNLSIDEGVYLLEAREGARGHFLAVDNGWSELHSPEFEIYTAHGPWVIADRGALRAQYPVGFVAFGALAFALGGFRGLFALQALAWALALLATARLAGAFGGGARSVRLGAVGLFSLATFSWGYAVAAWPHALTMALVAWGLVFAEQARATGRLRDVVAAATCLGVAVTVRFDALFAAAVGGLWVLARAPRGRVWRWMLAFTAGVVVWIGVLAVISRLKYGVTWPFYYGNRGGAAHASFYARFGPPLAILGTTALLLARTRARTRRGQRVATGVLVGLVGGVALWLATHWGQAWDGLRGVWAVFGDATQLDPSHSALAAGRPLGAAVVYSNAFADKNFPVGGVKKAVLQSMPWLAVTLAMPWRSSGPRGEEGRPLDGWTTWELLVLPAVLLAVYGPSWWHGGFCLNMRYFTLALPVLAVFGARQGHAFLAAARSAGARRAGAVTLGVAVVSLAVGVAAIASVDPLSPFVQEEVLSHPLRVALVGAALTLLARFAPSGSRRMVALAVAAVMGWTLGRAAAVNLAYDVPVERAIRAQNARLAQEAGALIDRDAVLLATTLDPFFALFERGDVRLATVTNDQGRDVATIVRFFDARGVHVYGAMQPQAWANLEAQGRLDSVERRALGRVGIFEVQRLLRPHPSHAPSLQ